MAKREVLGKMACPACDFDAAEIKRQKCGVKLYLHCPECNVQVFARTEQQEKRMRQAIEKTGVQPAGAAEPTRPAEVAPAAPVAVKPAEQVKVEKPAAKAKPEPEKAKSGLSAALGFLGV